MRGRAVNSGRVIEGSVVFTAGRRAPAGTYRDIESGRTVVMDSAGNLPGTCDGRVAAYVMRRSEVSVRTEEPAMCIPAANTLVCERCSEAGIRQSAELVYRRHRTVSGANVDQEQAESLAAVKGRQFLCRRHFEILPSALRGDYVPITLLHRSLKREL